MAYCNIPFKKVCFMPVDWPFTGDGPIPEVSKGKEDKHKERCRLLSKVLVDNLEIELQPIYCRGRITPENILHTIRGKLESKTDSDLVILYFHGRAIGKDEYWEWKVGKPEPREATGRRVKKTSPEDRIPPKNLNGYSVMEALVGCKANTLAILECQFPDNLCAPWRPVACNEVVWSGGRRRDEFGELDEDDGELMTDALIAALAGAKDKKSDSWSTLRQLMAQDDLIAFKPRNKLFREKNAKFRSIRVAKNSSEAYDPELDKPLEFGGAVDIADAPEAWKASKRPVLEDEGYESPDGKEGDGADAKMGGTGGNGHGDSFFVNGCGD